MRIPHLSRRERLRLSENASRLSHCARARVRSFRRRWKKTAAPARAHPPRRAAAQMQCAQPSVPPRTQRRATTMLSERRQFTGITAPPRRHGCGLTLTFPTASPAFVRLASRIRPPPRSIGEQHLSASLVPPRACVEFAQPNAAQGLTD